MSFADWSETAEKHSIADLLEGAEKDEQYGLYMLRDYPLKSYWKGKLVVPVGADPYAVLKGVSEFREDHFSPLMHVEVKSRRFFDYLSSTGYQSKQNVSYAVRIKQSRDMKLDLLRDTTVVCHEAIVILRALTQQHNA